MITIPLSEFGLMTVAEVALFHGVDDSTALYWIRGGRLPAARVAGRCYLVRRADCEHFVRLKPGPRGPRTPKRPRTVPRPAAVLLPLSEIGLMTVAEAARHHGRAEQTVWRWLDEGRIPAVPTPIAYLLRRSDCEAFRPPKRGAPSWADGARR